MTHYFKLEQSTGHDSDDLLPQEGVIGIDLTDQFLKAEMVGLDAPNEKFYLASSTG